jgi:C-terminal processing protease CtpA/Prc
VVDIVERGTPAYISKLMKGDILMAVQGVKVTSMSHASKLLKASGRRFTIRVERKRSLANVNVRKSLSKLIDL